MAVSGGCAAVVGLLYAGPPLLLTVVVLLFGLTIVADSAQFSAGVAELSEPDGVGTMLTLQTSVGVLLTPANHHLVPSFAEQAGWRWAFAPLALDRQSAVSGKRVSVRVNLCGRALMTTKKFKYQ